MANSSFDISVSTPLSVADMTDKFVKDTSDPRGECEALSHLFKSISSGLVAGSLSVTNGALAPVRATGGYTLSYADIADDDTVTIGGTVLTCKTGTPSTNEFKKEVDGATTAVNLAAAINAQAAMSLYCYATAALLVVTITVYQPGTIGNLVTLATDNATGFVKTAALLASGAGGGQSTPVSYVRG